MDFAPIVPWLSAVALLISIGTSVTAFFTSGSKRNAEKLADVEGRVQKLEGEMRHLPDKDAVHRLELTLKDLQAEIMKIGTSAEQSARSTARMETYLLEQKKSAA